MVQTAKPGGKNNNYRPGGSSGDRRKTGKNTYIFGRRGRMFDDGVNSRLHS